jgi:hypothetical protein
VRILDSVERDAMTAKQIADHLKEAAPKVHYHVRELERVGLLRLVETREKGGVLEKYYRSIAPDIFVPATLLSGLPPNEATAAMSDLLQLLTSEFLSTLAATQHDTSPEPPHTGLMGSGVWLTPEEYAEISSQFRALLDQYRQRRGLTGEREWMLLHLAYDVTIAHANAQQSTPVHADSPTSEQRQTRGSHLRGLSGDEAGDEHGGATSKRVRVVVAGALAYSREDLERAVARGEVYDIHVVGHCAFAHDIPAALVDRAVARFRHRGALEASPEVRAVLAQKREEAATRA